MKWFRENKIRVLKWLGNSTDMNLIENLRNVVKDKIHAVPTTTERELIHKLIKVWFHSDKIDGVVIRASASQSVDYGFIP